MKKLGLLLLGILLGFLLCYFFYGKQEMTDDTIEDPKPPKNVIDPGTIAKFTKAYDTRFALINNGLGIEDNRSSWYSLSDMRQYLDYAEFKNRGTKTEMDGIRIYPAVNDGGLATFLIVPTSSSIKAEDNYKSKGSVLNLNFALRADGGDIPDGDGLDMGGNGNPPSSNYPQN